MGLNTALAAAGRSLEVFSAGIQVAGQNIANANTPGYIREELQLQPALPYEQGGLIFGTGVFAEGVRQQIDLYLEVRLHAANSDYQAAAARQASYLQLEGQLRELGDQDLSTSLNRFLAAIHEVVNQPESSAMRQFVIDEGNRLTQEITALRTRLDRLRSDQTDRVEALTKEANALIDEIARLNPQIARLEASGLLKSDAGALRSQRLTALNRLSEIIPIRFSERAGGSVDVFAGSDNLILSNQIQHLETTTSPDRNLQVNQVRLSQTKSSLPTSGGELQGVIEGRDAVLGGFIDELDKYVSNLIWELNRLHSSGEGLKGFTSVTGETRVVDSSAPLNAADLAFTPQHGSFQLKVTNTLTGITQTANIAIDLDGIGAETSLNDLLADLNAVDNVSANVTPRGQLSIAAANGFEIRFANDTSGVLAALGVNTFFSGMNSADIGINATLKSNADWLATALGGGPSDGSNAGRLANFIDNPLAALGGITLNAFYDKAVSAVATASANESAITQGFKGYRESLRNQREQFSGVSIDEEAIKMIQFQRSFQAAARMVSTIDELFTILLQI